MRNKAHLRKQKHSVQNTISQGPHGCTAQTGPMYPSSAQRSQPHGPGAATGTGEQRLGVPLPSRVLQVRRRGCFGVWTPAVLAGGFNRLITTGRHIAREML